MKQREPRRKVLIKARMRLNGVWGDVRIQNISSRGLLLQAPFAPARGTYLEVYRGRYVIVARVAWADGRNFGVQTQDRLDVDGIISEPDMSGLRFTTTGTEQALERRSKPREPSRAELERRGERSRQMSRAMEFACVAALGCGLAIFMFDTLGTALRPLTVISTSLASDAEAP